MRCLFKIFCCLVALGSPAGSAFAAAILDPSLILIRQYDERADPQFLYYETTTDHKASNLTTSGDGSAYEAHGNLATGQIRTAYTSRTTGTGSRGSSFATLFDTVTFTTPGGLPTEISYSLSLDGILARAGPIPSSGAGTAAYLSFVDITGLATWLDESGSGFDRFVNWQGSNVARSKIEFQVGDEDAIRLADRVWTKLRQ